MKKFLILICYIALCLMQLAMSNAQNNDYGITNSESNWEPSSRGTLYDKIRSRLMERLIDHHTRSRKLG